MKGYGLKETEILRCAMGVVIACTVDEYYGTHFPDPDMGFTLPYKNVSGMDPHHD